MEVLHYEEHDDGSATLEVSMELEEREKLIELGLITAIKNFIKEEERSETK